MEHVAGIFQFVGLAATSAMALLAFFFKFTEETENSSTKKLTRPGKIFLLVTCLGITTSYGSISKLRKS